MQLELDRRRALALTGDARTQTVSQAVANLAAWFETMRGPCGYGGPVAHWWSQSLLYTGAAHDWRYEGIIAGYLQLWRTSGDTDWLERALRAGDDLLNGQQASGHYLASAFELNPAPAGTPHEAACDVGLLLLAGALRELGRPEWERYAGCAARNLRLYYIERLWDTEVGAFRDSPLVASFVPNKAATACEAFMLLAELTGEGELVERFVLPNLERILAHQVRGGQLEGAIAQNSFGPRVIAKYFPLYIARCVPALLRARAWQNEDRYAEAALAAMGFVARQMRDDGTLPTVVYPDGSAAWGPAWVAPLGDVLRVADLVAPLGFTADLSAMEARLLAGQDASGGIQTATGFAGQAGGRLPTLPDVRDLLHVAGWCDKAFRYLAGKVTAAPPAGASRPFEAECVFRGRELRLRESAELLEISQPGGEVRYRWRKGASWPEVAEVEFWLR